MTPPPTVAEPPAIVHPPAEVTAAAPAVPPAFGQTREPANTNVDIPASRRPSASAPAPTLAEAFAALLAAEQGRVAPPPPISEQALRDDVVEEVTRRVIERMTDGAVREVALEVAERVVREEIERIKTQTQ